MWIDSHCHLNHERNEKMPDELVREAFDADISGMMTINTKIHDEFDEILGVANAHDNVWCSVGTHPHSASDAQEKAFAVQDIVKRVRDNDKCIAIGETGLDYFYDYATREDQEVSFRKHCAAAREAGVPVIIHARDADDDVIRILKEEGAGKDLRGVLHCFSSGAAMAREALDFGFTISFSGIVTFPKATELQEIAKSVPLDRILVETDAPFLAPHPYRGKCNAPAMVSLVGKKLAELHNIDEETMARYSTENFFRLFNKAKI